MRISLALILAALFAASSSDALAQAAGINSLNEQIREQQSIVAKAPGQNNGAAWLKLAVLLQDAARYSDAEPAYRRAIELLKSADRASFADAADHMGTMYVEIGQYSKAEPLEQQALTIREGLHDPLGSGISHMHLAVLLLGKGELASADAEAQRAVSLLVPDQARAHEKNLATPEQKMTALTNLSLVKCAQKACAEALPHLRHALNIAQDNYPANSLPVGYLEFMLGYALWKSGDTHSAADLMEKGTRELTVQLGWGHPTYIQAIGQYRAFLAQQGHSTEANQIAARLAELKASSPQESPSMKPVQPLN